MNEKTKNLVSKLLGRGLVKSVKASLYQAVHLNDHFYRTKAARTIDRVYRLGGGLLSLLAGRAASSLEKRNIADSMRAFGQYAALDYDLKHLDKPQVIQEDFTRDKNMESLAMWDKQFDELTEEQRIKLESSHPNETQNNIHALARALSSESLRKKVQEDVKANTSLYMEMRGERYVLTENYQKLRERICSKLISASEASTKKKIESACRSEAGKWQSSGEMMARTLNGDQKTQQKDTEQEHGKTRGRTP